MSWHEQALLVTLLAFAAGVAVGRLWARMTAKERPESGRRLGESLHYLLGLDYLASRQIDRAIAELTRAARADTEAIEIYLILGNLLREKGQLERAIQIHQSILHRPGLAPQEKAYALLCLGMDFKRAGFRDRAVTTLEEVLRLDPGNRYATQQLLKIREEDHDWGRALELQQGLATSASDPDKTIEAFLQNQVGESAMEASEGKLAARSFEAAIRLNRRLAAPYLHLGDLLARRGQISEAIQQWEALVGEAPEHAYLAFDRLERAYESIGEPDRIERIYREVIGREHRGWRAHLAVARKRMREGKTAEAVEHLLSAAENNPHAVGVHLQAWKLFLDQGASEELLRSYVDRVGRAVFFLDPHICTKCHYRADGILWRCPHCQEWNTFVEERLGASEVGGSSS